MRIARLAVICLAALALTGAVQARTAAAPAAPQGLKAFLLRADEQAGHEFSRTPSFAWLPVRGAIRYEFELAKNHAFNEGAIFWSDEKLKVPAASVPLALPWMTGSPYAVYARVRAITAAGVTAWSRPYGFNVRWGSLPQKLPDVPGLSRWTPVDGASPTRCGGSTSSRARSSPRRRRPSTSASSTRSIRIPVHRRSPVARSGGAQPLRHDPVRAARRHPRPVEPDLHVRESRAGRRCRHAYRHLRRRNGLSRRRRRGASQHSRVLLHRHASALSSQAYDSIASTPSATPTASTSSTAAPWSARRRTRPG